MKIAIVKLSALGDIIHTMIVLQFIKKYRPDCIIDWIVEERFKGILEYNPDINKIHTVNLTKVKQRKSLILLLKEFKKIRQFGKYDLVIDAQGLLKSAIVAKFLGAKKICGFDKKSIREPLASIFYHQKINIPYSENIINRNVELACNFLDISVSNIDISNKKPFLYANTPNDTDNIIATNKKNILFVVGASFKAKQYPKDKYSTLANALDANILLLWGNDVEKNICKNIFTNTTNTKLLPKLSLNALKQLVAKVNLVIGGDTGPTYIAWALNIPSITLFAPTPWYRNCYQTNTNLTISTNTNVNPYKIDKNDFSIRNIVVADVVSKAKKLLLEK